MKMHKIFAGMSAAAMAASLIMALPASADEDTSILTAAMTRGNGDLVSGSVEVNGDGNYRIVIEGVNGTPKSLASFTVGEGEKDVEFVINSITVENENGGDSCEFLVDESVSSFNTADGAVMPSTDKNDDGEYLYKTEDGADYLYLQSNRGGSFWTVSKSIYQASFTYDITVVDYTPVVDDSSSEDSSAADDSTGDEDGITATSFGAQIYSMGSESWHWTSASSNFNADGSVTLTASYDDIFAGDDTIGDMGVQFYLGDSISAEQGVKASIEYSVTDGNGNVIKSDTLPIDFSGETLTSGISILGYGSSWDDLAAYGDITLTASISDIEVYDISEDSSVADSSEAESSVADSSETDGSEVDTSSVTEGSSETDTSSETSTGSGDASSASTTSSKAATSSSSSTTKKDSNPSTGAAAAAGAGILLAAFAVISVKKNK